MLAMVGLIALVTVILLVAHHVIMSYDSSESHDITQTEREMTDARTTLAPLLNSLNVQLGKQVAATCITGDPSLYAHTCGTGTTASYVVESGSLLDAETLSQRLQLLDASLKKSGWNYGVNDFRVQANQPVDTWASIISTNGVDIAYSNKTCSLDMSIWSSETPDAYRNPHSGGLGCHIDGGPPSSP
jgi:hypothetical protein